MPSPIRGTAKDPDLVSLTRADVETAVGEFMEVVGLFQRVGIRWNQVDFVEVLTDVVRDLVGTIDQWQLERTQDSLDDLRTDEVGALRAGVSISRQPHRAVMTHSPGSLSAPLNG